MVGLLGSSGGAAGADSFFDVTLVNNNATPQSGAIHREMPSKARLIQIHIQKPANEEVGVQPLRWDRGAARGAVYLGEGR